MNILILNWRDIKNPRGGGAEKVTHEYAKAWVQAGHRVTQFSSFFKEALTRETIDGVKIIRRGSHFTVHLWAFLYFILKRFSGIDLIIDEFHFIPFFTPLYARKTEILGFIHEVAKDVWFSNLLFPLALLGCALEPIFFLFYRKVPFLTVSPSTKTDIVKFGIPERQISVIFDGIDCQPLGKIPVKEKKPMVCFVGYLSKDKGVDDAIVAFSKIARSLPQAQFWVVGKGGEEFVKKIKKKANNLGLSKKIKFWGFVPEKQKLDLMKRAHVLINPSQREGWGIVVIEANAMGTPVVGYNVPGLRDSIQDRKTGILTEKNTPKELAKEVLNLFKDKKLYQALQKNALLWSKKFTWEKAAEESLELIEGIISAIQPLRLTSKVKD